MLKSCKRFIVVGLILTSSALNCLAGEMGPVKAYKILGLTLGAPESEINRSYLKIYSEISRRSDSMELATQLSAARSVAITFVRADVWGVREMLMNEDEENDYLDFHFPPRDVSCQKIFQR